MSRAVMTRSYLAALEAAGIPNDFITSADLAAAAPRARLRSLGRRSPRRLGRYAFTLLLRHPLFFDHRSLPGAVLRGRYVIAHWVWEQTELPSGMLAQLDLVDEIWAASAFVQDLYLSQTDTTAVIMPMVATRDDSPGGSAERSREWFGIDDDRFVFLTIASALSSHERKNPLGTMHAFRSAFPHGQTEALLVIKLIPTEGELGALDLFTDDPAFGPDIRLLVTELTDEETSALFHVCDCFVSLHRSEGFGLGAAEAMSLGKPTIVTAWSGPVDYLTDANSLPVPFTMRVIDDPGLPWYAPGLEWAEPDLDVAAASMRRIADDPDLAARLGAQGRIDIHDRYSVDAVGRAITSRLRDLHRR